MEIKTIRKRISRFYRRHTAGFRVLPDFLIIGAKRSGTTSLYENLTKHPNVVPAYRKELSFFDHRFERGLAWYRSCFPLALHKLYFEKILKRKFVTGEASANYFFDPLAPERVSRILPDIKLILLLRNPVDRAYSDYHYEFRHRNETLPFEEAIQHELQNASKGSIRDKLCNPKTHYLQRGIYIDHLQVWRRFFERDRFLILKSEDFYQEPSGAFETVVEFLGLSSWQPREYAVFREPGKKSYLSNYGSESYPEISASTRKELIDFFRPHNQRLYDYLHWNLAWEDEDLVGSP